MKGDDYVADFQIPDDDLKQIRSKPDLAFAVIIVMRPIDRTSYARFDYLTEGILVVLGGQNDALAIADRITLGTLAAEAAEKLDAEACPSDEGVMPDSGVSYYLLHGPKHLIQGITGFIGRRGSNAGEKIEGVRSKKAEPNGRVGI